MWCRSAVNRNFLTLSCCLTVGIDFGRAYFRVRWFLPWLSPRTSVRLPWLRFPKLPYDPGQPVFPGPVQTLAFLRRSSRCQRDLSAGTHASLPSPVYHRPRPLNEQRHSLAQWPAAVCPMDRQVPRAPLPDGIITSAGAMSCTASKGVTLSSLLLRAHAPARLPSAYFSLGLVWRIFAGYCQFLLRVGPSRRYLRETLLGCLDLCHGGIRSALARYFLHIVGLPPRVMGRLPTNFHPMTSWWALFSRLQPFLNVQTSKLACHPGHPYRNGIPIGQLWRLHPGRTCVVTSTCTGYAIRPKRAIDGRGLSPHKSYGIVGYSYPLQRTRRVAPALYPGRVLLWQVPFGQSSSLHPLRNRLPGFVRGLLRYYRSVRLPKSVRHRRTSLDFPTRPKATAALGGLGISRFPREVSRYVHGVSDRAGLGCTSRNRCTRWGLPLSPTASASRRKVLTRLNTRPARSLSTLRRRPCEQLRMTRGRCGSLLHIRMTFAFTTPRRFNRRTGDITMRFMVIVKANKDSEAGVLPNQKLLTEMGKYNEELVKAGVLLAGEGLHASSKGKRVRFSGGNRTVIDGPFAETKELIAGFWLWQVRSMEEAIEWVKRCPSPHEGEAEIEIRQVFEAEDFGSELTPELRTQEERPRAQAAAKKP